jgi:lipopolysaccharide export system permease protein
MNNRVYKYFFYEFLGYFFTVLFAITAIIWTIQAVNFLDLITEDGHAFGVYTFYSFLLIPKIITKLIPFAFLISLIIVINKFEKDNELIALWTSGLNKIYIVHLVFRISLFVALIQILFTCFITPETLKVSRSLLKNSQLQFIPSLLKEKIFNDTVKGLTIFVERKNSDGSFKNIFIEDEGQTLTSVSTGATGSTIFAKSGYVASDDKSLILYNGSIQKSSKKNKISIVNFEKTIINLSNLTTKTITEPKIQETSTKNIIYCIKNKNEYLNNCNVEEEYQKDLIIEVNKRFGMPFYLPVVGLMICFLLSTRRDKKISSYNKYIYFALSFIILICSEISVRYSGSSFNYTLVYYIIPISLFPLTYLLLIRSFKYENLN